MTGRRRQAENKKKKMKEAQAVKSVASQPTTYQPKKPVKGK